MKNTKSERELLEKYLKEELDKRNIKNEHNNPKGIKGIPDRIVFGDNIYYIELKLGKENNSYYKLTPMQEKWRLQIEQTNAKYYLLNTREEIDKVVEEITNNCIKKGIKNYFAYNREIKKI